MKRFSYDYIQKRNFWINEIESYFTPLLLLKSENEVFWRDQEQETTWFMMPAASRSHFLKRKFTLSWSHGITAPSILAWRVSLISISPTRSILLHKYWGKATKQQIERKIQISFQGKLHPEAHNEGNFVFILGIMYLLKLLCKWFDGYLHKIVIVKGSWLLAKKPIQKVFWTSSMNLIVVWGYQLMMISGNFSIKMKPKLNWSASWLIRLAISSLTCLPMNWWISHPRVKLNKPPIKLKRTSFVPDQKFDDVLWNCLSGLSICKKISWKSKPPYLSKKKIFFQNKVMLVGWIENEHFAQIFP